MKIESREIKAPLAWIALISFFVLMQSFAFAMRTPYGEPPDEIAHMSYVADAKKMAVPDYTDGRIRDHGRLNYLSHPPAYYSALGAVSRVFDLEPHEDYRILRTVSSLVFGLGFFLSLMLLRTLGASTAGIVASGALASVIPMFTYLGGSINNDTLAYTSTASFLLGFARYQLRPGQLNIPTILLLVAGVLGAALSKATTAAFIVFFAAAAFAVYFSRLRPAIAERRFQISALVILVVSAAYFIPTFLQYGSLFPRPDALYVSRAADSPHSFLDYTTIFVKSMWERLPVILSHRPVAPYSAIAQHVFHGALLTPVIALGIAMARRDLEDDSIRFLCVTAVASVGFGALHLYTAYSGYLEHGHMAGIQPRYYWFLLPLVVGAFSCSKSPWLRDKLPLLIVFVSIILFWGGVPDLF